MINLRDTLRMAWHREVLHELGEGLSSPGVLEATLAEDQAGQAVRLQGSVG